ncbi:MAG: class I SAM-dependent methyltransferase [Brevundimonas sp.]|uniref:class I SAM-dependent methyltransferase n=1 Tax=Brevundimonas sp. TaxID=1871086 RepID=UPI0027344AE0|nr:class I SAM-dependent methyltransferase [Brevundimonas sp.]MDP3403893.1 class I SAM-dependent methyltransferase [Brevundimonas sp.]
MTADKIRTRPPEDLVRYTCGHNDVDEYLRSGREVAQQFELASARHFGPMGSTFHSILDFGCGAGRILDALDFGSARVAACDVGIDVATFSKGAFPAVDVRHTGMAPPLPFENGAFDLVYSFSVFSHLTRSGEDAWLEELSRVGGDRCAYLITVHGDWMIEATLEGEEQETALRDGFFYKIVHNRNQTGIDFPEDYEASYHTSQYIREHWSKWFEIIDVVKGENPRRYLFGDLEFEYAGGSVPDFRPMGQDLVIARKRQTVTG